MLKCKKTAAVQSADAVELKRLREGLNREALACRAKAGALAVARDELSASSVIDAGNAVAFLQGQVRALYGIATALDDLRTGDDCPF